MTKKSSFVLLIANRLIWIGIGAIVLYLFRPSPNPIYETVVVTKERIIEREPDTVRTFIDRIVTVQAEPEVIAIAELGAEDEVSSFCSTFALTVQGARLPDTNPSLLLRSITYDRRWSLRKDRLLLTGPFSNGDLGAFDYEVRGDYTVRVSNGNALVQYPRTSPIYDLWEGGTQIYAAFKLAEFLIGKF